jgi:flavin-dependent dehydrogenase
VPTSTVASLALESFGIAALWGAKEHFHSHLVDADGNGWHVDRAAFSSALFEQALAANVEVSCGQVTAIACERGMWSIKVDGREQFRARFLIDATGRGAAIARRIGIKRRRIDGLCGVATIFPSFGIPQTLCVESTPYGWWYLAPFPGGRAIACLMSDVDIIESLTLRNAAAWRSCLMGTRLPGVAAVPPPEVLRLQVLPCESSALEEIAGAGWIAVGDAACVVDPLASAGVLKALQSGRIGADAVYEYLSNGSQVGLTEYCDRSDLAFRRYLSTRRAQYRLEKRWSDHLFWARRQN